MSDWNMINSRELDDYITGHYGEDQFLQDCETICFECSKPSDFVSCKGVGLCVSCAKYETENEVF